jgi:hypothetical protein
MACAVMHARERRRGFRSFRNAVAIRGEWPGEKNRRVAETPRGSSGKWLVASEERGGKKEEARRCKDAREDVSDQVSSGAGEAVCVAACGAAGGGGNDLQRKHENRGGELRKHLSDNECESRFCFLKWLVCHGLRCDARSGEAKGFSEFSECGSDSCRVAREEEPPRRGDAEERERLVANETSTPSRSGMAAVPSGTHLAATRTAQ